MPAPQMPTKCADEPSIFFFRWSLDSRRRRSLFTSCGELIDVRFKSLVRDDGTSSKPTGCGPWNRSSLGYDTVYLRPTNEILRINKRVRLHSVSMVPNLARCPYRGAVSCETIRYPTHQEPFWSPHSFSPHCQTPLHTPTFVRPFGRGLKPRHR